MDRIFRHDGIRRLRIAHVVGQLDVGGMEKLLVEFARYADRSRMELFFVTLARRGRIAEEIEEQGWPVYALNRPSGLSAKLFVELVAFLSRHRIDVVHTHGPRALFYGCPAGRLLGARGVFYTRHGQGFGGTPREEKVTRLLSRLPDRVICVSKDVARLAILEGMPPARVLAIQNGINTENFRFHGSYPGGPAVMVGRMVPAKDVDTLLQATALVLQTCPDFRLELAGDGKCLPDLKTLAQTLGIGQAVRFLGEVRDVAGLLARASLFVLSSVSEGISLTVLEAMASGLPVVATRVGGNPEIVSHDQSGILVPPQDPRALADALIRMHRHPALARQMGQAGRQRVETYFDVRRMVREYEALYLQKMEVIKGTVRGPFRLNGTRGRRTPNLKERDEHSQAFSPRSAASL